MRMQGQVGLYECKGCGRIMRMKGELLDMRMSGEWWDFNKAGVMGL